MDADAPPATAVCAVVLCKKDVAGGEAIDAAGLVAGAPLKLLLKKDSGSGPRMLCKEHVAANQAQNEARCEPPSAHGLISRTDPRISSASLHCRLAQRQRYV